MTEIKLSDVKVHDNYRKTFDKAAMAELTASVKERGVLQPIIVRKNGSKGKYFIVAGHRRTQAAREAGLKTIPAVVREATDEEALEISLIENDQREDPNPMEQALAYKALLDKGKHTPETLAAKLDRSVGYVLGRLKLVELPDRVQKKILSGDIPVSHALLLTRLKNKADILEAAKRLEEDMTLRSARDMVQNQYSIKLDNVPFDRAECKKCPACSKNQAVLFPEAKSRFECFDLACYQNKLKAYFDAWLKEKEEAGFTILGDEEMKPLLENYRDRPIKGRFAFPENPDRWTYPKKYKTKCVKCKDRGYYLAIGQTWRMGKQTASYRGVEVCLKGDCYDKMMGHKKEKKESSVPGSKGASYAPYDHAKQQRDRFLRATLPDKLRSDKTVAIRLGIYHLVRSLGSEHRGFDFEEFTTWLSKAYGLPVLQYMFSPDEKFYLLLSQVPALELPKVMDKALADAVAVTNPKVLLQLCEEAGVNPKAEIVPDEVYLKTKTKGDLLALAPTFGVALDLKMKKGEMLDAVLKADLTGKLTAELEEVLTPLSLAEVEKEEGGIGVDDFDEEEEI